MAGYLAKQKEYIFLVASAANLSTYCVTAHCEMVRMLKIEGPEPEQIAIDHVHAKIPMSDKALLNFCAKLNKQPSKTTANDIETLRTYGFTEQQILEAVVIVGFAQFANTVAFGLGTVPDFHNAKIKAALGRRRESRAKRSARYPRVIATYVRLTAGSPEYSSGSGRVRFSRKDTVSCRRHHPMRNCADALGQQWCRDACLPVR